MSAEPVNTTPKISTALANKIASANTKPPKPADETGELIPFPAIKEFNYTVAKIEQWGNRKYYVQSALKRRAACLRRIGVSDVWIEADVAELAEAFGIGATAR